MAPGNDVKSAQISRNVSKNLGVTMYLVLYNVAAMLGWAYVIFLIVQHFALGGNIEPLWQSTQHALKIVQTSAALEIVHSALGLVKSPLATTFVQVLSRLIVLWTISDVAPPAQTGACFVLMCSSWAAVEVPRYFLYILTELNIEPPYALTWLRYSMFYVLYVTGISGEVWSLMTAMPYIQQRGVWWDIKQPNAHNFTYSHYAILWVLFALYIPGSPFMYNHMRKQRQAKLYPVAKDKAQ